MSIARFMSVMRIERTKVLLQQTDLQCKEICLAVGFSREDVGAHVFKRLTGLTMEAYRKLARNPVYEDGPRSQVG